MTEEVWREGREKGGVKHKDRREERKKNAHEGGCRRCKRRR